MQIYTAKFVIPMKGDPIIGGAVAFEGDEIIDVGTEREILGRYQNAHVIDMGDSAILPGLINAHTHLDMSRYQNFPFDPVRRPETYTNFVDWLLGCIHYKKDVSREEEKRAVLDGIEMAIASGTTTFADMSSFDGVYPLLHEKHVRAVLFPEIVTIDSQVTRGLFENALAMIDRYTSSENDLITIGMGPHAPYTLSRNMLRIMSQYCRSSELPLMIHVAESFSEMEFFHNSSGDIATQLFPNIGWDDLPPEHLRTPLQHLFHIGFLDASPILVGCTHATPSDFDLIARSGSKVVMVPRSHMNLKQGKLNYKEIINRKILCALGTDGMASVDSLSLWDEMRTFLKLHSDSVSLSGHDVLSLVTSQASRVLQIDHDVGTLEKGKKADLIVVEAQGISLEGDFIKALIDKTTNLNIRNVLVNGAIIKSMN